MNGQWPVRPLRALAEVSLGRQRSPDKAVGPNMVPYLRAANVKDGRLDLEDVMSMDFSPSEQTTYALRPGDVLVTDGAGSLAAVGAAAAWNGEVDGMVCFQNTLLRLRPRPGNDPRYLMWWARHAYASGLFASIAGGANIYHLGAERVRLLPASMPELPVQRAIADYLDAETARIDELLGLRKVMAWLVEEREQAHLANLLGDWQTVPTTTLRQARTGLVTGPFGTQLAASEYVAGGTPVINPTHIADGRIDPDPDVTVAPAVALRLARHGLEPGDIVMGRKGDVGRAAVIGLREAGWICGSDSIAIRTDPQRVLPDYLALVMSADYYRQQLEAASTGAMVANVNESILMSFRIPDVPVEHQRQMVEVGHHIRQLRRLAVEAIERQRTLLLQRRQALITAAVSGDLEIPQAAA